MRVRGDRRNGVEANEPESIDLRDLGDLQDLQDLQNLQNPQNLQDLRNLDDDLLAELSPALRAAIERVYSPDALEGPGGFNSFVDADL